MRASEQERERENLIWLQCQDFQVPKTGKEMERIQPRQKKRKEKKKKWEILNYTRQLNKETRNETTKGLGKIEDQHLVTKGPCRESASKARR